MTTTSSTHDDLSFLRQLAERGSNAPLMAGPYLIAGGLWFSTSSLLQWPVLRDALGLGATQALLAYLVAALGFGVHVALLARRDRATVETTRNRAINSVWSAIGFGIFAFWLGVAVMSWQSRDVFVMNTILLQVMSVYGIGWSVAAAMARERWMSLVAVGAFATVPIMGFVIGTGHEYLVYALAIVLWALVPGLRLSQAARQPRG